MHLLDSILALPLAVCYAIGAWLDNTVLTPWSIGMTAKQILEEQLGVYGVLAFLVYKAMRLLIDAYPLFRPDWLRGDARRALAVCGLSVLVSYLVSSIYIGIIMPVLQLEVGIGGLVAASVIAWISLVYHYAREKIDAAREAMEAAEEQA